MREGGWRGWMWVDVGGWGWMGVDGGVCKSERGSGEEVRSCGFWIVGWVMDSVNAPFLFGLRVMGGRV